MRSDAATYWKLRRSPQQRQKAAAPSGGGSALQLAEADEREVSERRDQPALEQLEALRAREPAQIARPAELGGAEAEPAHHRLQRLLDDAAQAVIGADARQDDQFAARTQHADELVERDLRV